MSVRVIAAKPGCTAAKILKSMPDKVLEGMIARTPPGRQGRPEDLASAGSRLGSEAAVFMAGPAMSVDGGLVAGV